MNDLRPCRGLNGNVCAAEGCFGQACTSANSDADARLDAEIRDALDNLDDARTEEALELLLDEAPDLARKALRELSLIDPDAVTDVLHKIGALR